MTTAPAILWQDPSDPPAVGHTMMTEVLRGSTVEGHEVRLWMVHTCQPYAVEYSVRLPEGEVATTTETSDWPAVEQVLPRSLWHPLAPGPHLEGQGSSAPQEVLDAVRDYIETDQLYALEEVLAGMEVADEEGYDVDAWDCELAADGADPARWEARIARLCAVRSAA